MAASADTREYQRGQVALRAVAYSDTSVAWRLLDPERLDATFPKFATAILGIIETRRATSGELAREYLAIRRSGIPGAPPEVFVPKLDRARCVESLRITSVISIKSAMTRGVALPLATRNALVRTMGVVDRFVGDGGRELIQASLAADPAARGWVRVTLGTCDFCSLLAGKLNGAGDLFPRHDHCGCQPEPAYSGHNVSVTPTTTQRDIAVVGSGTKDDPFVAILQPRILRELTKPTQHLPPVTAQTDDLWADAIRYLGDPKNSITLERVEFWRTALRNGDDVPPILVTNSGLVMDGHHRGLAAILENLPVGVRSGEGPELPRVIRKRLEGTA